jgi:hypothetical protein
MQKIKMFILYYMQDFINKLSLKKVMMKASETK